MDLKIPTQVEPVSGSFPGSPRKVRKWLSDIQGTDIGDTTRQLYRGLKHSNRLVNDPRARVEVMELFRPTARQISDNLLKRYTLQGLPLPEKARRIFDLNLAFIIEMAVGYKIALLDSQLGNPPLSPKIYAMASHRAISYLSEVLLRCVQNYTPVKAGVWHDLHQLFASCEATNSHTYPISDNELTESPRSTVEDAYKRALLLSLSRPEALRKGEVIRIYNALETWVSLASLNSLGTRKDNGQLFGVNLNSDSPPTPLRFLHASQGAEIRTLDLSELLQTVTIKLDAIPEMESPIVVDKELPRNALVCLKANWGMQTERKSARATRSESVTVEVGLQDIHAHMVHLEKPSGDDDPADLALSDDGFEGLELMEVSTKDRKKLLDTGYITHPDQKFSEEQNVWDTVVNKSALTELAADAKNARFKAIGSFSRSHDSAKQKWSVVNISSGGYGLKWTGESTTRAHVGELIALHESSTDKQTTQWRIGVLRWMQFFDDNSFECGVQTISPRIVPVMVDHKRSSVKIGKKLQECLMLPEIKPIGQAASLIAPAHLFRLGETAIIHANNRETEYKLVDLEEQTGSFSQFLIQSTSPGAGSSPGDRPRGDAPHADDSWDEFDSLWDKL